MTLLSKAVSNTPRASSTLIRSQALKQSSRRYVSEMKSTSIKTTKPTSKSSSLPPLLSSKLFELPKPRPLEKQRYESTAGLVESSLLVLSFALVASLYAKEHEASNMQEADNFESEEDYNIHEFIRPFDCYVVEEIGDAVDVDEA